MAVTHSREFYTVVPSSYIFFRNGEHILLSKRKNTGYHDGEYSLPAGHIEQGEYALEGAIREAKEETGVDIAKEDLKLAHVMYRMCADHVRADYFFETREWKGEISNPEPDKCDALDWYPLTKLPPNIIPYIRVALEKLLPETYIQNLTKRTIGYFETTSTPGINVETPGVFVLPAATSFILNFLVLLFRLA